MEPIKTSAAPEAKLHFLDYWRIIRIRKTVILAVFLLVVLTATVVTLILPEQFSSMTRIEVERDVTDVQGLTGGQVAANASYDPYFIQTEFEIIQSQVILDEVIQRLDLNRTWGEKFHVAGGGMLKTTETRAALRGMIHLQPTRNTALIEISVYDDNPDEAAQIANTVADVYKAHRENERKELTKNGIDTYESKLKDYDAQVKAQEQRVDYLRKKNNIADTDPTSTGPGETLGPVNLLHYDSLKIENEANYVKQKTLLDQLEALTNSDGTVNWAILEETIPTAAPDGMLAGYLSDLASTEQRLVTLTNDEGPQNPDVTRTIALEDELKTQIHARLIGIITGLKTQVAINNAVVELSDEKVNEAKTNDMALVEQSREYFLAKADLEEMKRFRDALTLRRDQEQIEYDLPKTKMVSIIDVAEPNKSPVRPKKVMNIMLGVVIGLVVGVGLAFFIEYLDTSVKTIDDVERTLQAPVLGVIPQNVGFLLEEGAESPHAEAYRVLRTNLLFSRKDDKLNTLAVVSAGAGEGKSTTVFNLATVFAQSGQRVLMVDSDLRRPTLHKLLNVANNLGLTNYLLKQNTLEEVVQTTSLATLDFLASGKLPSSSLGILSSAQMKDFITELKRRYDYVFFDSPPIMGVSDASILASEVDMTLQVIQYRRYPQPMNVRAKQLIEKVGGNLIGIVLNNINMSQDESYYYYSGYYHDYYSKNDEEEAARPQKPPKQGGDAGAKGGGVDIKPKY
jgi:succinoglycan biosynthesis transport protein ExoP